MIYIHVDLHGLYSPYSIFFILYIFFTFLCCHLYISRYLYILLYLLFIFILLIRAVFFTVNILNQIPPIQVFPLHIVPSIATSHSTACPVRVMRQIKFLNLECPPPALRCLLVRCHGGDRTTPLTLCGRVTSRPNARVSTHSYPNDNIVKQMNNNMHTNYAN